MSRFQEAGHALLQATCRPQYPKEKTHRKGGFSLLRSSDSVAATLEAELSRSGCLRSQHGEFRFDDGNIRLVLGLSQALFCTLARFDRLGFVQVFCPDS